MNKDRLIPAILFIPVAFPSPRRRPGRDAEGELEFNELIRAGERRGIKGPKVAVEIRVLKKRKR